MAIKVYALINIYEEGACGTLTSKSASLVVTSLVITFFYDRIPLIYLVSL